MVKWEGETQEVAAELRDTRKVGKGVWDLTDLSVLEEIFKKVAEEQVNTDESEARGGEPENRRN